MTPTICDVGSYWSRVGCQIGQPSWLSDVGIPLGATLIGLAVAAFLVRSQIRHDRRLRHADRISPAVAQFGQTVLEAVTKAHETAGNDPYWDSPEWDGHMPIYRAQQRLAAVLARPTACDQVYWGSVDVNAAWMACVQRKAELAERGVVLPISAVSSGIDAACTALWSDLIEAAEVLVRWDGLSELPTFDPWPHLHIPKAGPRSALRKKEERSRWLKYYADEFERVALQYAAR